MRIRAIRGAGIASLSDAFAIELDDEPLRSAGVFVITGPTGAGKSTILDVLCLALFDTAPRLERAPRGGGDGEDEIRASDPRSLVHRGASEAWAEVDFDGLRGGSFRARWEVRAVRRRDGTRTLGKPSMSLVELHRDACGTKVGLRIGTTKTDVLRAIEARLGLDFAQLCRSVLLPQGELASFLEAPDDDKARLLERITGTEVYSALSRAVHARAAALARMVKERTVELEAVPRLREEDRAALAAAAEEATRRGARATKRLAEIAAAIRLHETSSVLRAELAQAEREATELGRQLELWEPRRHDVELAHGTRALRAEWEAFVSSRKELEAACADERRLEAEDEALAPAIVAGEATREQARARLASLEAEAERFEASVAAQEAALVALAAAAAGDAEIRARRRRAELVERDAQARLRDAKKTADACESALDALERELGAIGEPSSQPLASLLREELRPGEPCPVCGSREHSADLGAPGTTHRGDASTVARALEKRRNLLARRHDARVERERALATLVARTEEHRRSEAEVRIAALAEEEAEIRAVRLAAERARVEAEHGKDTPVQRRAARAQALEAAREQLARCDQDLRRIELSRERTKARLELVRERVAGLREIVADRGARLEAALAGRGLTTADLARVDRFSDRELDAWAAELERLEQQRDRQLAILGERRRRLELHAADVPADLPGRAQLEAAQREAEAERAEAELARARAEARIADDDARRADWQARSHALAALEAEAATWEVLCRLVGSADGKKLRVLVQSMALDVLLSHANHHLHLLAPRFQLVRRGAGSLALDVIDGELEGVARPTSGLSGGERFLVSLALALGLGTMTAERDDIGSLFLDEGFGSLDEESLDQALEVLDALRQAGRQIGVVSHVGRLAERFEVRVEVLPTEAGASVVRVRTA